MLPSQTARSTASRAHMYRRGKGRPWLIVASGAALIVVSVFVIKWMASGSDENLSETSTPPALTNVSEANLSREAEQAPPPKQPQAQPERKPEPVKIAMGESLPASISSGAENTVRETAGVDQRSSPETSEADRDAQAAAKLAAPPPPTQAASSLPPEQLPARTPNPPRAAPSAPSNAPVSQRVQTALDLERQNKPVEARKLLSEALASAESASAEAQRIREELARINERLVFSPEVAPGDTFASAYQIASGDSLARIVRKLNLAIDWRFLQRINRISDASKIRAGQRIKVIKGPFHVIIDKRTFRADLYLGDASDRVYVRSFSVGLGEFGATPEGAFALKPDSKLINPAWTNPRTGESFQPDDPKNPLGEYWIGLVGASDNIRGLETYGIHGTIDPASIGKEMSMGCVRLLEEDIRLLYEVLTEPASRVEIHGHDWP